MKINYERFAETKEEVRIDGEFSLYFNYVVEVYDQQKADYIKLPAIEIWNEIEKYPYISVPIWHENKQNVIEVTKKVIMMFKQLSKVYEEILD